ncbi:MAG: TrmJ/YjtD family RNA methyltransferase [Candidatus Micrarchaeia archaeon]|jgi:TrmH family RNA methyltransferase
MLRVVLVEPEHDLNVGSVARCMKNFGNTNLWIVRPRCKLGFEAKKFAKHSEDVLKNARITQTVEEATAGCRLVVGTTGVADRFRKNQYKNCVSARELAPKLLGENAAILFGGEGRGLDEKTIAACDLVATVPTSPLHRVLNLSHAVAVVLYECYMAKRMREGAEGVALYRAAHRRKREVLEQKFGQVAAKLPKIKNRQKVSLAFKRVLERSIVADDEAQALFAALSSMNEVLDSRDSRGEKSQV